MTRTSADHLLTIEDRILVLQDRVDSLLVKAGFKRDPERLVKLEDRILILQDRIDSALVKAGFDPAQPRDPAGQWSNGGNYTISDTSIHDARGGEQFGVKELRVGGEVKAAADINIWRGEVQVQFVKTREGEGRKGYATALINDLFREFPADEYSIRVSNMTPEGSVFFRRKFNLDDEGFITRKVVKAGFDPNQARDPGGQWVGGGGTYGTNPFQLSTDQISAINYYTETGYKPMNAQLRGLEDATAQVQAYVRDLDGAMVGVGKTLGLKTPRTTLYRSLNADIAAHLANQRPGTIVEDRGFMSTTASEGRAQDITLSGGYMIIDTPGDHPGIYVDPYASDPYRDEREVILRRGTKLQLISSKKMRIKGRDITVFNMRVV